MGNVAAKNQKLVGYPLVGKREMIQMRYDFAKDGGATTNVIQLFKALQDLTIVGWHAVVKTTCTSGGSATVSLGLTGAATQFTGTSAGAVANLVAGAMLGPDVSENVPVKLAAGDFVIMTIATAALTAGVIEFTLEVMKP